MSSSLIEGDLKIFQSFIDWMDIETESGLAVLDDGLENPILISILTNRRADATDTLPAVQNDRKGWWGDALDKKGRLIGSKLWLRQNWKLTPDLVEQAKQDIEESIEWMIEDKIVDQFIVDVTISTGYKNRLEFKIVAIKEDLKTGYDYFFNWQNQLLSRNV